MTYTGELAEVLLSSGVIVFAIFALVVFVWLLNRKD